MSDLNKVFAISDLHLSFTRNKPMDVFGEHWRNHPRKIEENWCKFISNDDVVLISGDVSWAMKLKDAQADIDFIENLPGKKIIIRGNHDYWFPKSAAKREALADSITFLFKSGTVIHNVGYIGCKGLSFDPNEYESEETHLKELQKQMTVLQTAYEKLEKSSESYETLVVLVHYPPTSPNETSSPLTEFIEKLGAKFCVYGHLHNELDFSQSIQGEYNQVRYVLASADFLSFTPVRLL